ncbi:MULTISPECIES: 30S ribosome-binding factor RbfA [Francisella]|uniref:Ribosome-binding factor A n=1 Tax=Francisella adeliensis TaxID=2007306 RepID=A0A2Z4Y0F8_9GAMM|nr:MULTISPECIES: 30S ribosome-binding factor RbfA [Francisella]AXA34550.1 ribosome-binding factor A [Francisella adeliensis]MBK2086274.1 30S ribosome-binding factor RbfA [Francisella adeliensis]MBK2096491.1 30S ribosome-binding factor RbfA [Francisella adeliensis]QIW12797.1 30S ribosome-binding factor RbfA [Francisella adeliensis]QIW14675.1 30S ribosome-binding factor RbfA [Francisella adeliensis]
MAAQGRVHRVESELKKVLAVVLRTRINDTKLAMCTITEVEVSKDLSYAKIYYSCLIAEDVEYSKKAFQKSKGLFRNAIASSLKLRIVPELKFIYDDSLEYGAKMESKIQDALDADAKFIKQDEESLEENYKGSDKDSKVEKLR